MYPQIFLDISQCVSAIFPVPYDVGLILVHESSSHTPSRHGFLVVTLSSGITGGRTNGAFKDTETNFSFCACYMYSHCSGNQYSQDNIFEDIILSALPDRKQSCTCSADACKPAFRSVHVLPDVYGFVFSMTRHGMELTEILQSHKAWQAPG